MLRFRSDIDDFTLPAIPADRDGLVQHAVLLQLEQSQWLSADEIFRLQFEQLSNLMEHAKRHVPFYEKPLADLDCSPESLRENWSSLPTLKRVDVQTSKEALVTKVLHRHHGKVSSTATSGSTGRPVQVLKTHLSILIWRAFTVRDHIWQGRDVTGKLAAIRESAFDEEVEEKITPHWGDLQGSILVSGECVRIPLARPPATQIDWLLRQAPDYLITFPSNLERLTQFCLAEGIRLPSLRGVQTISEILPERTRRACANAWGIGVLDMYSTREVGYLALQCPAHEHYHIQSEGVLVEVLSESGAPCQPGETGRVVATPLHNFAMPLIRYELEDYAEVGQPCDCGRGLPVLTRVHGRSRDRLRLRNGESRFPQLSARQLGELMAICPITQFQFVQRSLDQLTVNLVTKIRPDDSQEERLSHWMNHRFGAHFEVVFCYHEDLPLPKSGKFQEFISEVW